MSRKILQLAIAVSLALGAASIAAGTHAEPGLASVSASESDPAVANETPPPGHTPWD